MIDVEVDEVDIQNCIHHLENGVDFIPNKQALSTVEKQISTLDFRRECILFDALEDVRLDYDYILLDCMASLGMLAVNVMMACDTVRAGAAWKEFANYLCLNILFTKK